MNPPLPKQAVNTTEFIALMAACMSIVAISIDAMLPALGVIGQDLGASHANQPQFIITCIFSGMAIGQLICGPLSDALGRKRLLYLSLLLYLTGTLICLFANSMTTMLAGRFIQGLGVAGPYISTMSIVRDRYSGSAMGRIMSLVMMVFMMVPVIAPALGQLILHLASWRAIFVVLFLYASTIVIWIAFRLEETLAEEHRIPFKLSNIIAGAKTVLSNRTTVCYTLAAGCLFGSLIGYLNSSLQIFQQIFQVGNQFALYFGGLAMTLGVSSLLNSRLVGQFGMRSICTSAFLAMVSATAVLLMLHAFVEVQLWMFVLFGAVQFFGMGLLFGNLNALAMEPMGRIAGIASAIIGSVSSVISIVVGTVIGQLFNHTLYPLLIGFLGLGLLALFFLLIAEKRTLRTPITDLQSEA